MGDAIARVQGGRATRRVVIGSGLSLAILMTLAGSSATVAASGWEPRVAVSPDRPSTWEKPGGVALTGGPRAVVVYTTANGRLFIRRTKDAGATWLHRQRVSRSASSSAIAASGSTVDLVWSGSGGGLVRYVRSTNGGANFGRSHPLSFAGGRPDQLKVSRGVGGHVVVGWVDGPRSRLRVRVSVDGGRSFGSVSTFAGVDRFDLAVAGRDILVTYSTIAACCAPGDVHLRRSIDGGAS